MPAGLAPTIDLPDLLTTRSIRPDQIEADPFPHVVIEDAVEPALFAALADALPPLDVLLGGKPHASNERWNYPAIDIARNPAISPLWKEFARRTSISASSTISCACSGLTSAPPTPISSGGSGGFHR